MTMPIEKNPWPWLGIHSFIHGQDLSVEVRGSHILVAAPKSDFRVSYAKSPNAPQLILQSEWWTDRRQSPTLLAAYRACAWKLANDTATRLGWFDQR
jgi:hypothetical protein